MTQHFKLFLGLGLPLLSFWVFAAAHALNASTLRPDAPITIEDRLRIFSKLWSEVHEHFFDPEFNGVNWDQLKKEYQPRVETIQTRIQLQTLLQRMLDELHTSHVSVDFKTDLNVGTGFNSRSGPVQNPVLIGGQWVVRSVEEGSGAYQVGVRRGWILTQWNGKPYGGDTDTACDVGGTVRIRFLDLTGQEKPLNVACTVYPYVNPSLERSVRIVDSDLLYIRLPGFSHDNGDWIRTLVDKNIDIRTMVVDLRRNGGGDIDVVQNCLNLFFSEPTIFGEFRHRSGAKLAVKVPGRGTRAYRGRIFVLVDDASGSGAEVFAAGIQDSSRGRIVGRQSSGAVLNAKRRNLPGGFYSDIAHSDYRTSRGVRLEGRGVFPDGVVELTLRDFIENRDADLDFIRELLKGNVGAPGR